MGAAWATSLANFLYRMTLACVVGYISLRIAGFEYILGLFRAWAKRHGLALVDIRFKFARRHPELRIPRRHKLYVLIVRDAAGTVSRVWVAVGPMLFGLPTTSKFDSVKIVKQE